MSEIKKLRCAVYTRKSSEEGLDQAFNSLDAQREACVAYIVSQASLGWKLVPDQYDDGGISGGTLERPGIQRLLGHIREGRIDVVVVYKIDRLTRSLMDFAKLVEVFDGHSVSFVSVTQQFNTTTSMGRLTLNVLLSFAQFEREVTAERIRDKVAASKKKGMWMGGVVPLGYRAQDRKLVIEGGNAAKVRHIFNRYLELRSVPAVVAELNDEAGLGDAAPHDSQSPSTARHSHSRGKIYHLLSNPIYIGKIRHKGELHEGEHDAIIDREIFDAVQHLLAEQAANPKGSAVHADTQLLTGRLFDEHGNRLTPVHAKNHGKRYRYYVTDTRRASARDAEVWRLAATTIEPIVLTQLIQLLKNKSQLTKWIQEYRPTASLSPMLENAATLLMRVGADQTNSLAASIIKSAIPRVTLSSDCIRYEVNVGALLDLILSYKSTPITNCIAPSTGKSDRAATASSADGPAQLATVTQPITIKRRGVEMRIVVAHGDMASQPIDQTLVEAVAKAHLALMKLTDGSKQSIATVAEKLKMDASDVSRILPLAFLSPEITEAILTGRHAPDLTLRALTRHADLPLQWTEQDKTFAA